LSLFIVAAGYLDRKTDSSDQDQGLHILVEEDGIFKLSLLSLAFVPSEFFAFQDLPLRHQNSSNQLLMLHMLAEVVEVVEVSVEVTKLFFVVSTFAFTFIFSLTIFFTSISDTSALHKIIIF
jgi:hypothetical protein